MTDPDEEQPTDASVENAEPAATDVSPAAVEEQLDVDTAGETAVNQDDELPPRPEIKPETPDPENVVFVLVGVAIALFIVYRVIVIFGGG